MSVSVLTILVLGLAVLGFFLGRARAVALVDGDTRKLHSRPSYHGQSIFLLTAVPAFLLMLVWLFVQPILIENQVSSMVTAPAGDDNALSLVMSDVRRISDGLDRIVAEGVLGEDDIANMRASLSDVKSRLAEVGVAVAGDVSDEVFNAAKAYRNKVATSRLAMTGLVLLVSLAFLGWSYRRITPEYRARNSSEAFVKALLIGASLVAILTTVGIVLSLLFESLHFFRIYPALEFFTSTTWNPQFGGGSTLGILPLLWGTMYVSLVALAVAVPIGMMIAIYLSEYAGKALRSFAKPAIEVLAGIPTIVYGLFALITVGPLLRDWIAQPLGIGDSSSSVLTAGLVMGVMLIPFVSSLSDDIINAVPQSLRDGSYGLGATQSETIKQVILPAALPGVVGAILLAASRAIGETMIVVMGAGAAARMSLNPFEAMTTVTVKIVSQLTGDTEFASPETLVAFALGLTLFVITLGLNIFALYIVRKYREEYE